MMIYGHYYPPWSLVVRDLPISTPSINLLLVSRAVNSFARPVLQGSYTRTLDLSLSETCLTNKKVRDYCCTRYKQLLVRTNTLRIDVSKSPISRDWLGSVEDDFRGFDVPTHLPGLYTLILSDAFKCMNVGGLLAKHSVDVSGPDWETRSPEAEALVGRIADKRLNLSQLWVVIMGVCDGYRKSPPEDWQVWYKFRTRIEGVAGTYVSVG